MMVAMRCIVGIMGLARMGKIIGFSDHIGVIGIPIMAVIQIVDMQHYTG